MFDQLNDLPYTLVRERLLDARRERLAAEEARPVAGRFYPLRRRFADSLGDLLIAWGLRLKHREPRQDLAGGWAWVNRK